MRRGLVIKSFLIATAALLWIGSVSAQQVQFFPDFSSVANLSMNGGAHQKTWNGQKVLGLTDGYSGIGVFHPVATSAWFKFQQPVNAGFTTYFKFQIHTAGICCTPGDGLAFVVQNASNTDATYGATGAGKTARGVGNGGLGYAGIPNSLAVEFDTHQDPTSGPPFWDPNSNHVAVQSCGTQTNGPVHGPGTYTIGNNNNVTSCLVGSGINSSVPHLGVTCGTSSCADGMPHEVVIDYTPPATSGGNGTLKVFIDPQFLSGTHTPVPGSVPAINIPYTIDGSQNSTTGLSLAGGTSAYVGFTASQINMPQAHDILAWELTPHTATQLQLPIQGCPATNPNCVPPPTIFSFGANDTQVTLFPGFQNPPDPYLMTVVATPWNQQTFFSQRLNPGPFDSEQCVIYGGTGGNCIVYSITCQRHSQPAVNVPCPQITNPPGPKCVFGTPGCIQFTTGVQPLSPVTSTNADYLKAPIGTNSWQSIFVFYDPNAIDGRGGGTGGTTSDFVLTFHPNKP